MNINQTIYDEIKKNNNMITTSQVLSLGYSKQLLTNYVKEGLLERCRHGVYTLPNAVHDDMYTLMLRSEKIVFSHDTALFLNGLSERTPAQSGGGLGVAGGLCAPCLCPLRLDGGLCVL